MRRLLMCLALLSLLPVAASAQSRISDQDTFMSLVDGRTLTRPLVRLQVRGDGTVTGLATAQDVSGSWRWQGANFCWEFTLNGQPYQDNICLVVVQDGDRLQFSEDGNPSNTYIFSVR